MPKPVGSVETFSKPRDQELLIQPEEKSPGRHETIQDPILLEDFQYRTGSTGVPISNLSQMLDNRVLIEQIKRLTVASQLPNDHNSQAFPPIKLVSGPQQQLLRSEEVRDSTGIDRDSPSIAQYNERSDCDRHNKASFANDVFPKLQTNPILLKEGVSNLNIGNTAKHVGESSTPVSTPDPILKPLDYDPQNSIPELFDPLRQLKYPVETKKATTSRVEWNERARLRTSISIKAGDQAWHVTLTNSKGICVDFQEVILDDSSPSPLEQPQCRLPSEANSDGLSGLCAEGMSSDHSDNISVKTLNQSVGRTPDTRGGYCAGTGLSTKLNPSKVPFGPAPYLSFGPLQPSRIIEHSQSSSDRAMNPKSSRRLSTLPFKPPFKKEF